MAKYVKDEDLILEFKKLKGELGENWFIFYRYAMDVLKSCPAADVLTESKAEKIIKDMSKKSEIPY